MYLVLTVALLMLSFGESADTNNSTSNRATVSSISVSNGMLWGSWGSPATCPQGTYATGFSLKVHPPQGIWRDDTALNGIQLYCTKPITSSATPTTYGIIKSDEGSYGSWTQIVRCPSGVLKAFQLRVESYQYLADDTAANNIRFSCTGNQVLEGSGTSWGSWGSWSQACSGTGICGIQTRVEYGSSDNTALNNVIFYCC